MFKKFANYIWLEVAKKSAVFLVLWIAKGAVIICGLLFLGIKQFALEQRVEIVANPVKLFNSNTSKSDAMFLEVQAELKECNADGIFAGIFIYADGLGKFVILQGKWGVAESFNVAQKEYLENPLQIKDANLRGIVQACNSMIQHFEYDNTKYTNPKTYLADFNADSDPCKIDEGTKSIYASDASFNKVIDFNANEHYNYRTPFTQCIVDKLNLPKFNEKLKRIYIYPIKITGADFIFLTLTSTNLKDGACFSQDLMKQKAFFQKIQKIANYHLKI